MPRLKLTRKEQNLHRCTTPRCPADRAHYHETSVELIVKARLELVLQRMRDEAITTTLERYGRTKDLEVVPLSDLQAIIEHELNGE